MNCQHSNFRIYKGWLLCCDCEGAVRLTSPKGYYLLQRKFAVLQKVHQSLLDSHRDLCQEAGTTNAEELAQYLNQKAKESNTQLTLSEAEGSKDSVQVAEGNTFTITVDNSGVRQSRFSSLNATQANFYKRWLERNESESRPQIEPSYQQEKAIDDFYLWIEEQAPEAVKEFAIAAFVHLVRS